jgi:hypothetical protein
MPGKARGGFVLYEGPSRMDGAPIVVVLTRGSSNRKTGPMDQAWILRSDVHPLVAVREGLDVSICGDCRHRGVRGRVKRSCYVTVQHGPAGVYRAYKAGKYPVVALDELPALMAGRYARIGAYGDPTAAPRHVWEKLIARARGWTAYTHFWGKGFNAEYQTFASASVDTVGERNYARVLGWRTFRVRLANDNALAKDEIVCPASNEAGHRVTCQQCRICAGTEGSGSTKSVAIYPHGPGRVRFFTSAQQALDLQETQ